MKESDSSDKNSCFVVMPREEKEKRHKVFWKEIFENTKSNTF